MPIVKVTALKAFDHRGQRVAKGDLVAMEASAAAIAGRRGEVSLDRGVNGRSMKAETDRSRASAETAPRKRYRRRDMRAEE